MFLPVRPLSAFLTPSGAAARQARVSRKRAAMALPHNMGVWLLTLDSPYSFSVLRRRRYTGLMHHNSLHNDAGPKIGSRKARVVVIRQRWWRKHMFVACPDFDLGT
ncbi:hypothetical protein BDW68DRAFT_13149 [Aspergillus falconensis]